MSASCRLAGDRPRFIGRDGRLRISAGAESEHADNTKRPTTRATSERRICAVCTSRACDERQFLKRNASSSAVNSRRSSSSRIGLSASIGSGSTISNATSRANATNSRSRRNDASRRSLRPFCQCSSTCPLPEGRDPPRPTRSRGRGHQRLDSRVAAFHLLGHQPARRWVYAADTPSAAGVIGRCRSGRHPRSPSRLRWARRRRPR